MVRRMFKDSLLQDLEGEFEQPCRVCLPRKTAKSKGGHLLDFKGQPVTSHYLVVVSIIMENQRYGIDILWEK